MSFTKFLPTEKCGIKKRNTKLVRKIIEKSEVYSSKIYPKIIYDLILFVIDRLYFKIQFFQSQLKVLDLDCGRNKRKKNLKENVVSKWIFSFKLKGILLGIIFPSRIKPKSSFTSQHILYNS